MAVEAAAAQGGAVPRERPARVERVSLAEPVLPAPATAAPSSTLREESEPQPVGRPVSIVPASVQTPQAEGKTAAQTERPAPSQAPGALKICEQVKCRAPGKISIVRQNGSLIEVDHPGHPYVSPIGVVTVLPAEKIAAEFAQEAGKLNSPAYVESVREADRTVTFELSKSDGGPMLLTVKNPFALPLKYDASIEVLGRDGKPAKLRKTSTCAVAAQSAGFEMWPEPIVRVQAENIRLLPAGATTCK
jgi:hypothetical protein